MGRKPTRRARPPLTRVTRPVRQPNGRPPRVLAARLYELHAAQGRDQEHLERWPGDGELYQVLVFAERYADRLKAPEDRQESAMLRLELAEWLRQLADPLQLRAIDDARTVRVPWEKIALALGFTNRDGQPLPGSAANRRSRLVVAVHGTPEDRRQPEVAREVKARVAREEAARRERERTEDPRYPAMDAAARALLHHYSAGELLTDPDDDFWWDQLASVIDDRRSASERAGLALYVRKVVEETEALARRTGQPTGATEEARAAVAAAAAVVEREPTEGSA
jgi:hypothetical protein